MLPLDIKTIKLPDDLSSVTTIETDECRPEQAGLTPRAVDDISARLNDLYLTGVYPGIALSLRINNRPVLQRAIGHSHGNGPDSNGSRQQRLMSVHSPVTLFSTSKAITATLVHIAAASGAFKLEDRVADYIPEFAQGNKEGVTIAHVLSHTAGISSLHDRELDETTFNADKMVELLCRQKAEHAPGSRTAYHAVTGGYILGEIVKRTTGKDLRSFLNRHIRGPMKMKWFNYGLDDSTPMSEVAENHVTGLNNRYLFNPIVRHALGGTFERVVDLSRDERFYRSISPSANVVATADETCRFFEMLLNNGQVEGRSLIDPALVDSMTRERTSPLIDGRLLIPMRYSRGMMLGDDRMLFFNPGSNRAFGHVGFINILAWADPATSTAGTLVTTGKPFLGPHIGALSRLTRTIHESAVAARPLLQKA